MVPQKLKLELVDDELADSYDLFICSSSYEQRCLSIPNSIDINKIKQTFIVSNINLLEHIEENEAYRRRGLVSFLSAQLLLV